MIFIVGLILATGSRGGGLGVGFFNQNRDTGKDFRHRYIIYISIILLFLAIWEGGGVKGGKVFSYLFLMYR